MSRVFVAVHLAWTTRHRLRLLPPNIDRTLSGILHDTARRVDCTLLAVGSASDHVHVVARVSATTSIAQLGQRLKGYSSFELNRRRDIPHALAWQHGYFAESVSPRDLDRTIRYANNQRAHHDDSHPMEAWSNDEWI